MVNITKNLITCCFYQNENTHDYIVIHDTDNQDSGSNALANRNYFNNPVNEASAHYIVDNKTIIQAVEERHGAWHVGDGAGRYGINNRNSIGIEICVNKGGDYPTALKNAQSLVVSLLLKYNLKPNIVVRHYDASKKNCPASMNLDKKWTAWTKFQADLLFEYSVFKLVQKKVISSPDYWLLHEHDVYSTEYVKTLIQNMGSIL